MSKRFAVKIAAAFLLFFPLSLFSQWTLVTSHNATSSINAVWAQDANTAYAVTNDVVLKTSNGGQTWQSQDLSALPFLMVPNAIHFFNAQHGIIIGNNIVGLEQSFTTHDGGQTWHEATITGPGIIRMTEVQMVSPTEAFSIGWQGNVFKTTDGGQSWGQIIVPGETAAWADLAFSDPLHGKVLSENGSLYTTSDGGNTWQSQATPAQSDYIRMQFFNQNNGYLLDPASGFYSTSNGGQNWTLVSSNYTYLFISFFFTNPTTGWAIGNGNIYKTTNGGVSWLLQFNGNSFTPFYDIHFSNTTGWAVGDLNGDGLMYKTQNGGGFGIFVSGPQQAICNFETVTFSCAHDGASSFNWLVNGVPQGVNSPIFNFQPGGDGSYEITCTASNGIQSVSQTLTQNVYTEPLLPFSSQDTDSLCAGLDLNLWIGPLKMGFQYRIQDGANVLQEWTATDDGYYTWQYPALNATTTFGFYGLFSNCGWQKIHERTIHVVSTPQANLGVSLPDDAVCKHAPFSVRVNNSQPFVQYQVWTNQPWGAVATGGASPLLLNVNGLEGSQNLKVLASASSSCQQFLDNSVDVIVMSVEPSFAVSTQTIGTGDPLWVENTSADSLSFVWQFTGASPDLQNSTQQQPPPIHFAQPGTGFVTLVVTTPSGCKDTLQRELNVYDAATLGTTWGIGHDMKEQKTFGIDSAGSIYSYTDWYAKKIRGRPSVEIDPAGVSAVFYKHDKRGVLQWYNTMDDGDHIPRGANIIDQSTDKHGDTWLLVNLEQDPGYPVSFSSTDGRVVTTDKDTCMAIVHYSPFGVLRSIQFIESADPSPDPTRDVALGTALRHDELGGVFLLGSIYSSNSTINPLKLLLSDLNGALDTATIINPAQGPYFLLKMDENDQFSWVQNISTYFTGGGNNVPFQPVLLEPDRFGGCYVWSSGQLLPPITYTSVGVQLAHFGSDGQRTWNIDRPVNGQYNWANDLAVDQSGNAYVLGNCYGFPSFGDVGSLGTYFSKVGLDGTIKWSRTLRHDHSGSNVNERSLGIAVDENNKVYVLNGFDGADYRILFFQQCIDSSFAEQAKPFLTTWDSLGNLLQILPSNAFRFFSDGVQRVSSHLRAQNGTIYAMGAYDPEPESNFLGVSLPLAANTATFLARVPASENYLPYLNTCDYSQCELDSGSALQISYLFDQVQWNLNGTPLNGFEQTAIFPSQSGSYTATATDPEGNHVTSPNSAPVHIYPFPEAIVTEVDSSLMAPNYPISSYQWIDSAGNALPNGYSPIYYPDTAGWYQVIIRGIGSCVDTSALFYFDGIVGLQEKGNEKTEMMVVPNPNDGTFSVELPSVATPDMTFRIFGLTGQIQQEQYTQAGSRMQTVQAGDLPAGLYFLQVVSMGKVLFVEKFVKQ